MLLLRLVNHPASFLVPVLFLTSAAFPGVARASALKAGDVVAIGGDSITQQRIYSVFVESYLLACQPAADLQALQLGWGGEKAGGFNGRIETDVLPFAPSVVTTCYGMNDGRYEAVTDAVIAEYRSATQATVRKLKRAGVRLIVVGSPGAVDPGGFKRPKIDAATYNQTLSALAGAAREVAAAEEVGFADVHAEMMAAMTKAHAKFGPSYILARDGVHPQANGHLPMAAAFLKALGCDGEIGRITCDFTGGQVEADTGQQVINTKRGRIEIESRRYPFCFVGAAGDPATVAMLDCLPFNAQLNRYLLVVKNAPSRTRVTWGGASRIYSAAELAAGVNLAADFLKNPFCERFAEVLAAVQVQQDFEVPGIKGILHSMPEWRKALPEKPELITALQDAVMEKDAALRAAARAAVTPLRHELILEAAR
ncbi:MAG: GDSL-like Lipase/Acylhydrolase [Rariglobus sp.]|jgi:lysophospholipase L1-like esterase|nr:GDSL-like Lipase/Acylhydrolase [Rariglobus sp.]